MTSFTLLLNDLFKVNQNVWVKIIKSKMTYSESESEWDFSFAINLVSDFDSASECYSKSDSESDFSLALMNLDICIFFILYLRYVLHMASADGFFIHSHNRIKSYASNAIMMHIFFWCIITQNVCFYHSVKLSYFSFQAFFIRNRFAMKFNV